MSNTISKSDDVCVVNSNTIGAASGAGSAHPSGAPEVSRVLGCSIFGFLCSVSNIMFLETSVLCILGITISDYPFGIFKQFLCKKQSCFPVPPYMRCVMKITLTRVQKLYNEYP